MMRSSAAGIRNRPIDALPMRANAQSSATDDQASALPRELPREQRRHRPTQAIDARNAGMQSSQNAQRPFTPTSVWVVAVVPVGDADSPR